MKKAVSCFVQNLAKDCQQVQKIMFRKALGNWTPIPCVSSRGGSCLHSHITGVSIWLPPWVLGRWFYTFSYWNACYKLLSVYFFLLQLGQHRDCFKIMRKWVIFICELHFMRAKESSLEVTFQPAHTCTWWFKHKNVKLWISNSLTNGHCHESPTIILLALPRDPLDLLLTQQPRG